MAGLNLGAIGKNITGELNSLGSNVIGGAFNELNSLVPDTAEKGNAGILADLIGSKVLDTAGAAIGKKIGGPLGEVLGQNAGKIATFGNTLLNKAGGGTDGMTKFDKMTNSMAGKMTMGILGGPLGLAASILNGVAGKKSHELMDLQDLTNQLYGENMTSGFSGTAEGVNDTMQYSHKKYGLFSTRARKKANRAIDNLNMLLTQILDIAAASKDAFDILQGTASANELGAAFNMEGGYQLLNVHVGRSGFKLFSKELILRARSITKAKRGVKFEDFETPEQIISSQHNNGAIGCDIPVIEFDPEDTEIGKFQDGGTMNVIPEGALHKNLHHMKDGDNITRKGVPVVDNNGELQAEVERDEITFTLEVTKKLEEFWKKFKSENSSLKEKDEAAIEAGKLLTYEILENTDDRTGLIASIHKEGGTIQKYAFGGAVREAIEILAKAASKTSGKPVMQEMRSIIRKVANGELKESELLKTAGVKKELPEAIENLWKGKGTSMKVGGVKHPEATLTKPGTSPTTFNGELLTDIRSPKGGKVSSKFYTGKGSEYILTEDGFARRVKAPMEGDIHVGDFGIHDWNRGNTVFLEDNGFDGRALEMIKEKFPNAIPSFDKTNGKMVFIAPINGEWRILNNEQILQKAVQSGVINPGTFSIGYSSTPILGYSLFEYGLNDAGNRMNWTHVGHPVEHIENIL